MRVKVLRQFLNDRDLAHEGQEIEVTDARGRQLVKNGLVTMTVGAEMKAVGAAKAGAADPTPSPLTGGPTGAAKPLSSPRRGRPPRAPHLRPEEGEPGS